MEQKDIDILATDILNAIGNSDASPIAKLEMLKNMKLFLENYNENIDMFIREKAKRKAMFCEDDYDFCK